MMRPWHFSLVALCALPEAGGAQVVLGRVLEEGSPAPIAAATIRLLSRDGADRGAVSADSTGTFQLAVPAAGRYVLKVTRLGYVQFTSDPLEVAATLRLKSKCGSAETRSRSSPSSCVFALPGSAGSPASDAGSRKRRSADS